MKSKIKMQKQLKELLAVMLTLWLNPVSSPAIESELSLFWSA